MRGSRSDVPVLQVTRSLLGLLRAALPAHEEPSAAADADLAGVTPVRRLRRYSLSAYAGKPVTVVVPRLRVHLRDAAETSRDCALNTWLPCFIINWRFRPER